MLLQNCLCVCVVVHLLSWQNVCDRSIHPGKWQISSTISVGEETNRFNRCAKSFQSLQHRNIHTRAHTQPANQAIHISSVLHFPAVNIS